MYSVYYLLYLLKPDRRAMLTTPMVVHGFLSITMRVIYANSSLFHKKYITNKLGLMFVKLLEHGFEIDFILENLLDLR